MPVHVITVPSAWVPPVGTHKVNDAALRKKYRSEELYMLFVAMTKACMQSRQR